MDLTLPRPKTAADLIGGRSIPFRAAGEMNLKMAPGYRVQRFKTLDRKKGSYEAWVSIFGNLDLTGDIVDPGFFAGSLANWKSSGDPIPTIFSHQWDDPFAHIGYVDPDAIEEDDIGLHVIEGKIDIDKPFAAQVFDLMDARRIREFSFAYDVFDEAKSEDGANHLKTGDLIEQGPTLKGANPETILAGTKSLRDALDREIAALERFAGVTVDAAAKAALKHDVPDPDAADEADADQPVDDEDDEDDALDAAAAVDTGSKSGARNSAKDRAAIQSVHDASAFLGAVCDTVPAEDAADGDAKDAGADGKREDPTQGKRDDQDAGLMRILAEVDLLDV